MAERTIGIFIPGRPLLINAERSAHWRTHREATRDVRLEASILWRKHRRLGPLDQVKVDVYPTYAKGRLPDTGACLPTVKAVIDGGVDAGLLIDDTPEIVTHLAFHRPVIDTAAGDGVMVTLTELEEGSPWLT